MKMEASNEIEQRTCNRHGNYESRSFKIGSTLHWMPCDQCAKENNLQKKYEEQSELFKKRQESLTAALRSAGIPERFLSKRFNDYIVDNKGQEKALKICQRYAEKFDRVMEHGASLILLGNSGTGKNHLAMAIANEVIRQRYTAHYTDAYMMLSDIKHAQQSATERETDAIKALCKPDLLIIDEIGDQVGSEADKRLLNKIINQRYNGKRPTILMSNMKYQSDDGNNLKEFLGTRVVTRISEGGGKLVLFDWANYRQNIKSTGIWD